MLGSGIYLAFWRLWRAAQRWSWLMKGSAVKQTLSVGRFPPIPPLVPLAPTSPSSLTVLSLFLDRPSMPQTPVSILMISSQQISWCRCVYPKPHIYRMLALWGVVSLCYTKIKFYLKSTAKRPLWHWVNYEHTVYFDSVFTNLLPQIFSWAANVD